MKGDGVRMKYMDDNAGKRGAGHQSLDGVSALDMTEIVLIDKKAVGGGNHEE